MSHSRPSSSFGPVSVVATTKTFLDRLSTHVFGIGPVDVDGTMYPRDAFTSFHNDLLYFPLGTTRLWISPLCYAALEGSDMVIHSLVFASKNNQQQLQDELDRALFFANYQGHLRTINMLLHYGANPGRDLLSNGLHGAASRGLKHEICHYVSVLKVPVDVPDESFATPVMYAMKLNSPYDWDTIECLFSLGAVPTVECGEPCWTYAEYALAMGKKDLARRLEAAAVAYEAALYEAAAAELDSPTVRNSSRASSCTVMEDLS
ncbi:hypothetical protein IL306_000735 [Fusarium sp. DS 682]|nr:hypothetical protein IL306_000735 [Fusarium sp. DS 682]